MTWSARMRHGNLTLADPVDFMSLTLVENYGPPDTLTLTGDLPDLRAAAKPGRGCVLWQDATQRFSGVATPIERRGDGTYQITFVSDLVRIWDRIVYPTPTASWQAQTTAYDTQTASVEARILGFIGRNAGPSALNITGEDRRVPFLSIPSGTRGPTGKTRGRFQNLGQLAAELAESADLRVTIVQAYNPTALVVTVTTTADLSASLRFGEPDTPGAIGVLDETYSYSLSAPTTTAVLAAAGGEKENRYLRMFRDASREATWYRRIETFLDQRGAGTDLDDITEAATQALADGKGAVELSAPLIDAGLVFGPAGIPVGTKASVVIDGEVIVDRIRSITTTVEGDDETVVPAIGTEQLPVSERILKRALRRLRELERSQ